MPDFTNGLPVILEQIVWFSHVTTKERREKFWFEKKQSHYFYEMRWYISARERLVGTDKKLTFRYLVTKIIGVKEVPVAKEK